MTIRAFSGLMNAVSHSARETSSVDMEVQECSGIRRVSDGIIREWNFDRVISLCLKTYVLAQLDLLQIRSAKRDRHLLKLSVLHARDSKPTYQG